MAGHIFTGFGFGPIQGGLFVKEAFQSGNFTRIAVAEIDQKLIDAVRANKGSYYVNVAGSDGIEALKIDDVELLNPGVARDKQILLEALADSTEITTSLPSVNFYDSGGADSVTTLMAEGLKNSKAEAMIVYTAENDNRAAEILEQAVIKKIGTPLSKRCQFLNTVIGKMSRVVTDPAEIKELKLAPITSSIKRAFLVEEFNHILVSRIRISDFKPGIKVFIEKDNLLAFEEAKLYGHNAIHALLAYLGALKGYKKMTELKEDRQIMEVAADAFIKESGAALIKKYTHLGDELFTEAGYKHFAEDLLERMTNPYLADTVERAGRDPVRKLGADDRIFGTMALALEYNIEPNNMALGAMAGIVVLLEKAEENNLPGDLRFGDWRRLDNEKIENVIDWIWDGKRARHSEQIIKCVQNAHKRLATFLDE
jgi:mannitol-1-phosphate 5-dehydrogenase